MSHCLRPVNNAHQNPYADLGVLLSLFGAGPANASSYHHKRSSQHPDHAPSFIPNFNVIETPQAYILEGELPGLSDKKAVDIEFIDHQTLLVKGRISRNTATVPNAPTSTASTDDTASEHASTKTPTVEDVVDESDYLTVTSSPTADKGKNVVKNTEQPQAKPKPETSYWVTERRTGSFQRNFKFPGPIDQDNVTAKLADGILTIEVPKQTKVQTRKVEIQ